MATYVRRYPREWYQEAINRISALIEEKKGQDESREDTDLKWHSRLSSAEWTGGDYADDESVEHAERFMDHMYEQCLDLLEGLNLTSLIEAKKSMTVHLRGGKCSHCDY